MLADLKHLYVNQLIPAREGIKRPPVPLGGLAGDGAGGLLWSLLSRAETATISPVPGQEKRVSSPSEGKQ